MIRLQKYGTGEHTHKVIIDKSGNNRIIIWFSYTSPVAFMKLGVDSNNEWAILSKFVCDYDWPENTLKHIDYIKNQPMFDNPDSVPKSLFDSLLNDWFTFYQPPTPRHHDSTARH